MHILRVCDAQEPNNSQVFDIQEEENDEDLFGEDEICGEEENEIPKIKIQYNLRKENLLRRFILHGEMAEDVNLFFIINY